MRQPLLPHNNTRQSHVENEHYSVLISLIQLALPILYRIAGNFRGVQFSWKASLQTFRDLIFADAHTRAHYILYNRAYFAGLIFANSRLSAKTAKIGHHENFPLYGTLTVEARSCFTPSR